MKSIYTIILLLTTNILFAQLYSIKGRVVDATDNTPIPGVNIVIGNNLKGTITDFDGFYEINKIAVGAATITFSFISYETINQKVQLTQDKTTILDVKLKSSTTDINEVVVAAQKIKNSEESLISMKRQSVNLIDGISSQQMSKLGDSNAAGALKRVTGIAVDAGKYIYVRGLGDRYSKVTLNGAGLPGLDPNKNSIQMDIFPSNFIDNLVVNKTFTANLPGDFSGGHIDITTKDFPEQFTFSFSTSLGYNPQANLNSEFLSYEGGRSDWLAFDDGTRSIPKAAANIPYYSNSVKAELTNTTTEFNKIMDIEKIHSGLNQSHSFSVGNKIKLFGKPFGFTTGLSYSRKFRHYDDGESGFYRLTGSNEEVSNKEYSYVDTQSSTDVLIGGILNLNYLLNTNNRIGFNIIKNQNGENATRFMQGETQTDEIGAYRQTRTLKYTQRALTSTQLKGEHVLGDNLKLKLNWLSSYTLSQQDEPDLRFFTNSYYPNNTTKGLQYELSPSKYSVPTRLYRNLWENSFTNKVDLSLPFEYKESEGEIKMGVAYTHKARSFSENKYDYIRNTDNYNGSVADYISDNHIGLNDDNGFGLYIQDATNKKNNYTADQSVFANYIMIELPATERLNVIAGVRYEQTSIFSKSENDKYEAGKLDLKDYLPSLNVIYKLREKMNLRFAYNRTLARPTFREIAPFASEDFQGGIVYVGNPDLKRTLIDNIDLRWEMYMNSGEIISVSAFYKNFTDPIELADDVRSTNPQLTWRNVDEAQVYGCELEVKKNFKINNNTISIGGNFTYLKSLVSIADLELQSIRENDPNHDITRAMYGQSPYIFNSYLGFKNDVMGLSANMGFNVSGEKLAVVMRSPTPNIFEQPNPQLNFNLNKKLGKNDNMAVKFAVSNILSTAYLRTYTYKGREYVFSKYNTGRTYSLGFSYDIK